MVKQAVINWSSAGGSGGQTALYFDGVTANAAIVAAVDSMLDALEPILSNATSAQLDPLIRELNTGSGQLEGESASGGGTLHVGTGGAVQVPNAAQGLIRLGTSTIVNGRVLRGRIYVPGLSTSVMLGTGEVNTTGVNTLATAGASLVLAAGPVIWHRPVNGAGGATGDITSASGWGEFAVQRRRRS